MLAKNFDADLTNPRMYNTLEGLKEEHVYDEIKHKDCAKDPGIFFIYIDLNVISTCFITMTFFTNFISFAINFNFKIKR